MCSAKAYALFGNWSYVSYYSRCIRWHAKTYANKVEGWHESEVKCTKPNRCILLTLEFDVDPSFSVRPKPKNKCNHNPRTWKSIDSLVVSFSSNHIIYQLEELTTPCTRLRALGETNFLDMPKVLKILHTMTTHKSIDDLLFYILFTHSAFSF